MNDEQMKILIRQVTRIADALERMSPPAPQEKNDDATDLLKANNPSAVFTMDRAKYFEEIKEIVKEASEEVNKK